VLGKQPLTGGREHVEGTHARAACAQLASDRAWPRVGMSLQAETDDRCFTDAANQKFEQSPPVSGPDQRASMSVPRRRRAAVP
jgi:hypothetical protein